MYQFSQASQFDYMTHCSIVPMDSQSLCKWKAWNRQSRFLPRPFETNRCSKPQKWKRRSVRFPSLYCRFYCFTYWYMWVDLTLRVCCVFYCNLSIFSQRALWAFRRPEWCYIQVSLRFSLFKRGHCVVLYASDGTIHYFTHTTAGWQVSKIHSIVICSIFRGMLIIFTIKNFFIEQY